jgi:hypothetical protein
MRVGLGFLLLVAAVGSAGAQSAQDLRLRQARQECWAEVGVYGNPQNSRGSLVHQDTVSRCVRAKMAAGAPRR